MRQRPRLPRKVREANASRSAKLRIAGLFMVFILLGLLVFQISRGQQRASNFVPYTDAPRFDTVSDISSSVTATPSTHRATSVSLNLHACAPGRASISYDSGTTYFAFSGTKHEDSLGNPEAAKCIFYMGKQVGDQNWDGRLPAKCTWRISNVLTENYLKFPVTASGIQFDADDFLGNCRDLRTGVAPVL